MAMCNSIIMQLTARNTMPGVTPSNRTTKRLNLLVKKENGLNIC